MATDGMAAPPRDAQIRLANVRSAPEPTLARPPSTRQTVRKGRVNFLYFTGFLFLADNRAVKLFHAGAFGDHRITQLPKSMGRRPASASSAMRWSTIRVSASWSRWRTNTSPNKSEWLARQSTSERLEHAPLRRDSDHDQRRLYGAMT